jgi:peroxiredoxin
MFKFLVAIIGFVAAVSSATGQAGAAASPVFAKMFSIALLDVDEQKYTRVNADGRQLLLFVFLSPECPLCQNYSKTLNELNTRFKTNVKLYGVFPGKAYTTAMVRDFGQTYNTSFDLLIDPSRKFARHLGATITPQVILTDNRGRLLYTGAIDDWLLATGKKRLRPGRHYLEVAILQALKPEKISVSTTRAFGCKINDY